MLTNLFNIVYGMSLALIVFRTAVTEQADGSVSDQNATSSGLRDSLMDLGRLIKITVMHDFHEN